MFEIEMNFANALKHPFSGGVDLYLANKSPKGIDVVSGLTCMRHEAEGELPKCEPLHFTANSAQMLMDTLWNCGIRPSQDAQSVGQLKAISDHLLDMRHIAFKSLKMEKP